MQPSAVENIAAYKFVPIGAGRLNSLREELRQVGKQHQLKGTIILSPEGINLSIAGDPGKTALFWTYLTRQAEFQQIDKKVTYSEKQPFRRLYIKIKSEIITLGISEADRARQQTNRIAAEELKRWLDEKRDFTLLDTRNDYEVNLGTFQGARDLNLQSFRDFPKAADEQLNHELHNKPLVMFCTGGIRCEKAAPLLQQQGFREVYQLDGGILRYFESVGSSHFKGECFVFDDRIGLDGNLSPTGAVLCESCQMPLTVEQQKSPEFVPGVRCPYCRNEDELKSV